jgi:O-methyltransferase
MPRLPTAATPPIAFAWIDCDLYDSTVPVLDFLSNKLVDNAVIAFDDWFCLDGKGGEQRAAKEWLERNPGFSLLPYQTFHWAGQSFIFHR